MNNNTKLSPQKVREIRLQSELDSVISDIRKYQGHVGEEGILQVFSNFMEAAEIFL